MRTNGLGDGRTDVGRLFRAAFDLTRSWMSPEVMRSYMERAGVGVEPGQYQALLAVAGSGPLRLRDLAEVTGMTPSNASKIVAELVDAGLVNRTVPSTDRRVTLLQVTPAGRAAVSELERIGHVMLSERLAGFSAEEITTLGQLLERLARATTGWTSTLGPPAAGPAGPDQEEGAA